MPLPDKALALNRRRPMELPVPGRILQLSVSDGGVPKRAVAQAQVTPAGLVGDRQRFLKIHGGPDRALCLFSAEVIQRLAAEGHAAAPGAAGENVTVEGLPWERVVPGSRLKLGALVVVEITRYAAPCKTIAALFKDGVQDRISQKDHPGDSRVYARVLSGGALHSGDPVELED